MKIINADEALKLYEESPKVSECKVYSDEILTKLGIRITAAAESGNRKTFIKKDYDQLDNMFFAPSGLLADIDMIQEFVIDDLIEAGYTVRRQSETEIEISW